MATIKRNCDNCGKEYFAETRNLSRGWGKCCSKSCAASLREKSRSSYNPERVKRNNIRRVLWNEKVIDSNHYGDYKGKRTSEGYKIYGNTAVDEFDELMYDVDDIGDYDEGDSEYWDNSDHFHDW